ncbi:MAG: hypothetical protein WCX66_04345 [archaeon]
MNSKGQVSMEFMVSVLAVLLVFVFCMSIFIERTELNISSRNELSAKNFVYSLSRTINVVSLMDNNSRVCNYFYWNEPTQSISFGVNSIQVFNGESYADSTLITKNFVWSISDVNGLICFSKRNDFVFVEYGVD